MYKRQDIGSTTVKVVVLDENDKSLYESYERHFAKVREKAVEQLKAASKFLKGNEIKVSITGSAGLGVAKAADIPFVQEVYATARAVNKYIPQADAVIELGGEMCIRDRFTVCLAFSISVAEFKYRKNP